MAKAPGEMSGIARAASPAAHGQKAGILGLFAMWGALVGICALILWLDALQPQGILQLDQMLNVSRLQRLLPLAGLGLCGLVFAAAVRGAGLEATALSFPAFLERRWRRIACLSICAGIAAALAAVWALRAFPNSGDEYDYLFEAWTFLAGRLWNPLPPLPLLFTHHHLLFGNGKWVAGYPPGWPGLLAAFMALRLPAWLASPLAGGVLLFAVLKLGALRDGALGGVLAVALVAISPFFVFNAASYFDMVPAAAAGLLFCWAALSFLERPELSKAIAAGLALGALGLIRSQDVVLFTLPFAVQFFRRAARRHYILAPAVLLAGLPFLAALLIYNYRVFGSPLGRPGWGPHIVRYGLFPVDEQGVRLTPLDQFHFLASRLVMLAEWTSPLLALGYIAAFRFVAEQRRLSFVDFIFPAYMLGFMLVPFGGGNQYGPRYYFEAFPPLVLTVVSALVPLLRSTAPARGRAFFSSLVMAYGANGIAALAVLAFSMRTIVDQRMDLYDQVRAAHLGNAVVVLHSGTSPVRLMGRRDLTRNGIAIDGPVLYVLDIPDQLKKLRELFPFRRFYIYERDPESPKGSLRRLR